MDSKIVVGTFATAASLGGTWLEHANAWGELVLTAIGICVGLATLWYTVERARKLRRERKGEAKKD